MGRHRSRSRAASQSRRDLRRGLAPLPADTAGRGTAAMRASPAGRRWSTYPVVRSGPRSFGSLTWKTIVPQRQRVVPPGNGCSSSAGTEGAPGRALWDSSHRGMPHRPVRADLAAARAVLGRDLQQPAEPRVRQRWMLPLVGFFLLPWTTLAATPSLALRPQGLRLRDWFIVALAFLVGTWHRPATASPRPRRRAEP